MPLLRRRPFARNRACERLPDHQEVFHCEITDEIFQDYEEYCERIILVNSMVWSCEMTGTPNLTYAEALDSEKKARKSLRDFPMELRVPVLYLASRTRRCAFARMAEDIYNFVRDRYFVGETIEACVDGELWSEAHVLSVIAPKLINHSNNASSYTYEVEQFDDDETDAPQGNISILSNDRIRRGRGVFTRVKIQFYLKQFVEQGSSGIIQVKDIIVNKYNISKVKFDQIFAGDPPIFPSSKKFDKIMDDMQNQGSLKKNTTEKKSRQETMAKYITKTDKFEGTKQSNLMENNHFKSQNGVVSNRPVNTLAKSKRERSLMFAAYMKEWNKTKDDLELEDHKQLPKMIPIDIPGVSNKHFGDVMGILEFLLEFSKSIRVKHFFSSGVDMETLRRALTAKEVAGPLSDIIQMLLSAVFNLQEEEAEEYKDRHYSRDINRDDPDNSGGMSMFRGVQLATVAAKWSQTYLSTPLSRLPMDSQTFSEILRLHLLSSGSTVGENCSKWRYQQRGGYNSQDDPGLLFKLKNPHVLKALSTKHITQLPLSYKIKLINCLINQILTFSIIRDIIEENQEKSRDIKIKIKLLQTGERKREAEFTLSRQKIRRDAAARKETEKLTGERAKILDAEVFQKIEDLKKDSLAKKLEFEKKFKEYHSHSFAFQSYLGSDRAYRRYWMYETIEGLFVEHVDEFSGRCLDKPVIPNPVLATAQPEDALSYVQKMFETELNGANSDKENDSQNVYQKRMSVNPENVPADEVKVLLLPDLLMCTADSSNCPVHSSPYPKTQWSFIESTDTLDELVRALNKRGIREGELKQLLEQEKEQVAKYVSKCPKNVLNPNQFPVVGRVEAQMRLARKYVDANLRYPPDFNPNQVLEMALRDSLLDLEEKIHLGALGELSIKNRTVWRDAILNRNYDQQCPELVWGFKANSEEKIKESDSATYRDPGHFLTGPDEINSEVEEEIIEDCVTVDSSSVKSLACALLQIEQAVAHKHLKRPLGYDQKELNKDPKPNPTYESLKRWEVSLMESTSYAQINLHLQILENSIEWSRSILNANCRICRRKNDDENMLLCDSCNKGYHMYCLKPKLTKVPQGDWFCDQCKPRERTLPKKRNRKIFEEEQSADEVDGGSSCSSMTVPLCSVCRSGGSLVQCTECNKGWHSECLPNPLQRKTVFVCSHCSKQSRKDKDWDPKVRRCAADAMNNIDHYKKMLKQQHFSDSESGDEPLIGKAKKKKLNEISSPETDRSNNNVNSRSTRSRKAAPQINGDSVDSESSDDAEAPVKYLKLSNGHTNGNGVRKSARHSDTAKRKSGPVHNNTNGTAIRKTRRSEAIHTVALEELLNNVMNHKDSWPFNAPVTFEEAPDYLKVVDMPMDFGTIKRKLQKGKFANDGEFMNDSALVFSNCFKYNRDNDVVAKAGIRLQKFFEKKCKDLNLEKFIIDEGSDVDQQTN
ncbi:ATP-dependent chromatin assembly factor large subunit isoform X2 [Arctopsyche grandis]|uniref:ATP-dependent chromatin assembly factor large subunit isoform X2 n=1 Tax=Arctopsyche grandis TaxID=121162 RepID=UPI00406D79E6